MSKIKISNIINDNLNHIDNALKELEIMATLEDCRPNEANITLAIKNLNEIKINLSNDQSIQSIENELNTVCSTLDKLKAVAENSNIFNAKHVRIAVKYLDRVEYSLNTLLSNLENEHCF